MARDAAKIGLYISGIKSDTHLSNIDVPHVVDTINKAQCLYIRNIKDKKILFMSPSHCRLMSENDFNNLIAKDNIVNINYTELYSKYGDKVDAKPQSICSSCRWDAKYGPYIALIYMFYGAALGVDPINGSTGSMSGSTYEQYGKVKIKDTDKNLLQEFFINKPLTQPVKHGTWDIDDTYFSEEPSDYSDVEFGTLISLDSFKFHKKAATVTYELKKELNSVSDESRHYWRADFGDYIRYDNNVLESSTGGLFNILNNSFEDMFPDFVKKIKLNEKLYNKYNTLRAALMNRDNQNKVFMFNITYQNRHSLCINEIYDFDLIKRTFDYTTGNDYGDELLNIAKVLTDNNFIKIKMRYGSGALYLNKSAFTDAGTNIDIFLSTDSYNDVVLNFKNGRHKCSIDVTSDILNELDGSIPEEQLTMLKCELVLRQ